MYLKSITIKGFKSFTDRTKLDFSPGVSVVVGPNGSGKSNIVDALVWALGEQSPAVVRGQSMQDLIFGGAAGVPSRSSAEVELVLDNADGRLDSGFNELAITRRLDRNGDGEYRINGARCRLVDVLEALSDSGLGKEMHSVLSQGRVDAIVTSKPRDRRLLIEEAAGLGKHRKRRHRAKLKLARTRDNLDRVLDVEREARTRLKPLKRQAEAAETHERLERQSGEMRAELVADDLRLSLARLRMATAEVANVRQARAALEARLAEVVAGRDRAERAIADRASHRENLSRRFYAARGSFEQLDLRRRYVGETATGLRRAIDQHAAELAQLELDVTPAAGNDEKIARLETALVELDRDIAAERERQIAELEDRLNAAATEVEVRLEQLTLRRAELTAAEAHATAARLDRVSCQTMIGEARRTTAALEAELAAVNEYLRTARAFGAGDTLADAIEVEPGYETAVAAVLGAGLRAAVASDMTQANGLLDDRGEDGGSVFLAQNDGAPADAVDGLPGARPLAQFVRADNKTAAIVTSLLSNAWVVETLSSVPSDFRGIAVTGAGRVWFGGHGELRQAPAAGDDRALATRNRRTALTAEIAAATAQDARLMLAAEAAELVVTEAEASVESAHAALRAAQRSHTDSTDVTDGLRRVIERRRTETLADVPAALNRPTLEAELRAERTFAEQAVRAAEHQSNRRLELQRKLASGRGLLPMTEQLDASLAAAVEVLAVLVERLGEHLQSDKTATEGVTNQLRESASREAALQTELREAGEVVTRAEVAAQQSRDAGAEVEGELRTISAQLDREIAAAEVPLEAARREELATGLARVARRRELLGPVNPLAKDEYAEAVAHVEELEEQRTDLETAMRELESLIKEIDRAIRSSFDETFAATAANFEDVIRRLFPGGEGKLLAVREERPRQPALVTGDDAATGAEAIVDGDTFDQPDESADVADDFGVEIEVTLPGSRSRRRLTLLSGGEKSLVALAFVFAVMLTSPCPFYVLDEAEAALDDINIDRLLTLLREYSSRAQFIVVTHQKRTMGAADCLYGVSMGDDGVSKVVTRRLRRDDDQADDSSPEQPELEGAVA